jgi:excisionase family DNA binding protein
LLGIFILEKIKIMKLLTVKEVAQLLHVRPSTLYQWAELGQIPSIKLNGSLRFDFEDLNKWVESCKKQANPGYNSIIQARGSRKGGQ